MTQHQTALNSNQKSDFIQFISVHQYHRIKHRQTHLYMIKSPLYGQHAYLRHVSAPTGSYSGSLRPSTGVGQQNISSDVKSNSVCKVLLYSSILQLLIHFVGPHCENVTNIIPEDDPVRDETCSSYLVT